MMDAPARLIVECGEKRIMHCISDLYYRATNEFAKALLIANLFTESHTSYEDDLLAQNSYLEDFAILLPQLLQ